MKFVLLGVIGLACVSTTGCMTHSNGTYLSSGNLGYSISCGGLMTTWTSCLVKAGRLCGKHGYVITYSDEINHEMLVECKTQT